MGKNIIVKRDTIYVIRYKNKKLKISTSAYKNVFKEIEAGIKWLHLLNNGKSMIINLSHVHSIKAKRGFIVLVCLPFLHGDNRFTTIII